MSVTVEIQIENLDIQTSDFVQRCLQHGINVRGSEEPSSWHTYPYDDTEDDEEWEDEE